MTNWKKTYSTWVNGAIAVLTAAATAIVWLSQQANTPVPLHVLLEVLAGVTAFTVFLRSLPQGEKPEPKPRVRVEERGWVPFYLLPVIALFALVSLYMIACSPQATKTASHLASNAAAESLSWLDARLAAQYEVASAAELGRLAKASGTVDDWERWRTESGWAATIETVALAYGAHALLVAHLDGTKASTVEDRRQALELVTKAVQLGLTMLEQEKVEVPPYVRDAAKQIHTLGALL